MSEIQTIENIRNLISQGRTKIAAEHVIVLTYTRHKEFYEPALMLKSRLETLEKETIEGVLSHSEQSLEQAKILRALLSLTSSIEEAERPVLNPIVNIRNNLWYNRKKLIRISMVLVIAAFAFWGFSKIKFNAVTSFFEAKAFDLVLIMDITENNTFVLNTNGIKVNLGDKSLTNPSIQNDSIIYQHISQKQWDDSLNVALLSKEYGIEFIKEERKADKSVWIKAYKIVEKKKVFSGIVQFPNRQPAPLAIIEMGFQNVVFRATADAQGKYKIELPSSAEGEVVSLKIKHKGVSKDYSPIRVNETYLKLLTIYY